MAKGIGVVANMQKRSPRAVASGFECFRVEAGLELAAPSLGKKFSHQEGFAPMGRRPAS